MFDYIRGKLAESSPTKAVLDVNGIGYSLSIPFNNYSQLPQLGHEVVLYTTLIVREDAHTLYGFLTREQRELFNKLIEVSGIGPKSGCALIGHLDVADFQMAILHANAALICKVPGIGKKTAERLIIEMRDKVGKETSAPVSGPRGVITDAINALINLGYHPVVAQKAVKAVSHDANDLGGLITAALRKV